MKLKNSSMQVRILGASSMVCVLFLIANFLTNSQNNKSIELASSIQNEVYPHLNNFQYIQADIVQIQQWADRHLCHTRSCRL